MLSIATFIACLALAMLGLPIAHALIVGAQLGLMPSERLGSEFIVSQLVTQTQSFPLIAIPFFLWFLYVLNIVGVVVAAIQTSGGKDFKYSYIIRFIK